jgi:hypothetical protein
MQGWRETWGASPEAAGEKSIDANRPHGQPGAQPNARVLQRKIISALVKRQSLQTADHFVADPKAGAVANNRS